MPCSLPLPPCSSPFSEKELCAGCVCIPHPEQHLDLRNLYEDQGSRLRHTPDGALSPCSSESSHPCREDGLHRDFRKEPASYASGGPQCPWSAGDHKDAGRLRECEFPCWPRVRGRLAHSAGQHSPAPLNLGCAAGSICSDELVTPTFLSILACLSDPLVLVRTIHMFFYAPAPVHDLSWAGYNRGVAWVVALKTKSTESLLDHSLPHSNKYALPLHFLVQDSLRRRAWSAEIQGSYQLCWLPQRLEGANGGAREVLVTLAAQVGGKAFHDGKKWVLAGSGASCSLWLPGWQGRG